MKEYKNLTLRDIIRMIEVEKLEGYDFTMNMISIFSGKSVKEIEELPGEELKNLIILFNNMETSFDIDREMFVDGKSWFFNFRNEDLDTKTLIAIKNKDYLTIFKHYFVIKEKVSDDFYLDNFTMNEVMILLEHFTIYREELMKILPDIFDEKTND
ncbi:hypothetical protein UFOVP163_39 [uncultured Caudovirales phage]|uniref:Uncharacterized protein n=1 Tax=uncultured Caudovirales phage TaxID=2100421 RepID=A0A6J7WAK0_9CAUD|nr:hypothetical protein UFOVP163_39 [uncultured Caudovirales phage]